MQSDQNFRMSWVKSINLCFGHSSSKCSPLRRPTYKNKPIQNRCDWRHECKGEKGFLSSTCTKPSRVSTMVFWPGNSNLRATAAFFRSCASLQDNGAQGHWRPHISGRSESHANEDQAGSIGEDEMSGQNGGILSSKMPAEGEVDPEG